MGLLRYLFSFYGRFRRVDYWLCILLQLALLIVGIACVAGAGELMGVRKLEDSPVLQTILIVSIITYFVMNWICHVKRWHDHGWSGWWQLISFVPFGGLVILVVCGFMRGDDADNKYGPSPYHPAAAPARAD
jgi:uncharacterized membrane protein YhaH (DUF805 family)